jgi:hypothetical protein
MACHSLLLHWQIQTFISNKAFTLAAGTWVLTGTGYVHSKSIGRCAVGDGGLHFFVPFKPENGFTAVAAVQQNTVLSTAKKERSVHHRRWQCHPDRSKA